MSNLFFNKLNAQIPKELKPIILQNYASIITINDSVSSKALEIEMNFFSKEYTTLNKRKYVENFRETSDSLIVDNGHLLRVVASSHDSINVKKYYINPLVNEERHLIFDRLFIKDTTINGYKVYDYITNMESYLIRIDLSKNLILIESRGTHEDEERYYYYFDESGINAVLKESKLGLDLFYSEKNNKYKVQIWGNEIEMHLNELESKRDHKEFFLKHINNRNFDVGDGVISID